MKYPIFQLLEEAHGHGRDCLKIWPDEQKSFHQFLMQWNLVKEYEGWKNKQLHPSIAKSMKKKGYTIRAIAKFMGYKNPGSITHLLKTKK
jgi:ribonuclease HI